MMRSIFRAKQCLYILPVNYANIGNSVSFRNLSLHCGNNSDARHWPQVLSSLSPWFSSKHFVCRSQHEDSGKLMTQSILACHLIIFHPSKGTVRAVDQVQPFEFHDFKLNNSELKIFNIGFSRTTSLLKNTADYKCPSKTVSDFPFVYTVPGAAVIEKMLPTAHSVECIDPEVSNCPLEMPERVSSGEVLARGKLPCGLLKIRRRKMNKHKLRKLRKKMKFIWRRAKLKKAQRKEKAFQDELAVILKKGEDFNAEQEVTAMLKQYNDALYWQENPPKKVPRVPPGHSIIPPLPLQAYEFDE